MKIQKDLQVVLNIRSKALKNKFWCLSVFWNGRLCPISAHDCQMAHSHISTVPCMDWSAGDPLTTSSGAQLSPLGKKIHVKEGEKTTSWYLSGEFALLSPSDCQTGATTMPETPQDLLQGTTFRASCARSKDALSLRFNLLNVQMQRWWCFQIFMRALSLHPFAEELCSSWQIGLESVNCFPE